jgi:hypothetical protein
VKSCPIKIFAIEAYALSRKEFNYREKLKKLEKLNEKLIVKDAVSEANLSNEESINYEMTKSKGVPLVTWKEKSQYLR